MFRLLLDINHENRYINTKEMLFES